MRKQGYASRDIDDKIIIDIDTAQEQVSGQFLSIICLCLYFLAFLQTFFLLKLLDFPNNAVNYKGNRPCKLQGNYFWPT